MKKVPFISNTEDDLHCVQAALMSIALYFKPDFRVEWEEWSEITGFEPDKGTWPLAGILWFNQNNFTVKHIEPFDFQRFIDDGEDYLRQHFSSDIGDWVVAHTNIPKEQERTKHLLSKKIFEERNPTLKDLKQCIDDGYLVRAHVNSKALNNQEGYFGHAVVVFDYDDQGFTLHDPGLPALPNRFVKYQDFENAWFDPDDHTAEMTAVKH